MPIGNSHQVEFARRRIVDRPLKGTSALWIRLCRSQMDDLGGALVEMTAAIVEPRANATVTVVEMAPVSDLFRLHRR